MKKIVCLVLALLLVFPAGCGAKEPVPNDIYSETAVSGMKKAIEILDSFLAFDISVKEARAKLDPIADALHGSEDLMDRICGGHIANASLAVYVYSDNFDKIRELRDGLYESLYGK